MKSKTCNLIRVRRQAALGRSGAGRGFTLVELLVTLTAGSVLLLLAIEVLHRSLSTAKQLDQIGRVQNSWSRLGNQLRHDVHAAQRAESVDESRLTLHFEDGASIDYRIDRSQVQRVASNVATEKKQYERYSFDSQQTVSFTQLKDPSRIELSITRQIPEGQRLDGRVVAVVGRLLTLERGSADKGAKP